MASVLYVLATLAALSMTMVECFDTSSPVMPKVAWDLDRADTTDDQFCIQHDKDCKHLCMYLWAYGDKWQCQVSNGTKKSYCKCSVFLPCYLTDLAKQPPLANDKVTTTRKTPTTTKAKAPSVTTKPTPLTTKKSAITTKPIPVTTKAASITTKPIPLSTKAIPPTTKAIPVTTKATPITTKPIPLTTKALPITTKAAPITTKAIPLTTKAAPVTTKATPITTKTTPPTTKPTPATTKAIPVTTTKANPVTTKATLATTKTTQPPTTTKGTTAKATGNTTYICPEGQVNTLKCASGTLKIKSAMYGRLTNGVCTLQPMLTFSCNLDVTSNVAGRCNGKQSCSIASNYKDFGRDPCGGTTKYTKIEWTCA